MTNQIDKEAVNPQMKEMAKTILARVIPAVEAIKERLEQGFTGGDSVIEVGYITPWDKDDDDRWVSIGTVGTQGDNNELILVKDFDNKLPREFTPTETPQALRKVTYSYKPLQGQTEDHDIRHLIQHRLHTPASWLQAQLESLQSQIDIWSKIQAA